VHLNVDRQWPGREHGQRHVLGDGRSDSDADGPPCHGDPEATVPGTPPTTPRPPAGPRTHCGATDVPGCDSFGTARRRRLTRALRDAR